MRDPTAKLSPFSPIFQNCDPARPARCPRPHRPRRPARVHSQIQCREIARHTCTCNAVRPGFGPRRRIRGLRVQVFGEPLNLGGFSLQVWRVISRKKACGPRVRMERRGILSGHVPGCTPVVGHAHFCGSFFSRVFEIAGPHRQTVAFFSHFSKLGSGLALPVPPFPPTAARPARVHSQIRCRETTRHTCTQCWQTWFLAPATY